MRDITILKGDLRAPFVVWKGRPSDICSLVKKLKGISLLVLSYRKEREDIHCRSRDHYIYVEMITMWRYRIYSYFALRITTKTQFELAGFVTHRIHTDLWQIHRSLPGSGRYGDRHPIKYQISHRPQSRLVWRPFKKKKGARWTWYWVGLDLPGSFLKQLLSYLYKKESFTAILNILHSFSVCVIMRFYVLN